MKGANLSYLTKEGLRNVKVNKLMSIASISVLMFCMIIVGLAFIVLTNMQSIADSIGDKNVIIVYMPVEATQEQIDALDKDIRALSNIKSVVSVSKEEALQQQKEQSDYSEELWAGLDENPFPQSFQITVENLEKFNETLEQIKKLDNIDAIRENREFAEQLYSIRTTIYYISLGIIAAFLLMSLFIISNTIRITIFSRRLEISIMKSVGATRSFIRWPFMIEGMVIGMISGILGFLIVWGAYVLADRALADMLNRIHFSPVDFFSFAWNMLGSFLAGGMVIGGLGSFLSVGRYLKEQSYDVIEEQI